MVRARTSSIRAHAWGCWRSIAAAVSPLLIAVLLIPAATLCCKDEARAAGAPETLAAPHDHAEPALAGTDAHGDGEQPCAEFEALAPAGPVLVAIPFQAAGDVPVPSVAPRTPSFHAAPAGTGPGAPVPRGSAPPYLLTARVRV